MANKIFCFLKRFIVSGIVLYAYDSFNIFSNGLIPINFITLFIVTFFGFPGLFVLILFSFII